MNLEVRNINQDPVSDRFFSSLVDALNLGFMPLDSKAAEALTSKSLSSAMEQQRLKFLSQNETPVPSELFHYLNDRKLLLRFNVSSDGDRTLTEWELTTNPKITSVVQTRTADAPKQATGKGRQDLELKDLLATSTSGIYSAPSLGRFYYNDSESSANIVIRSESNKDSDRLLIKIKSDEFEYVFDLAAGTVTFQNPASLIRKSDSQDKINLLYYFRHLESFMQQLLEQHN